MTGYTPVRNISRCTMNPQQPPEFSIWPHIGTRSGGGIRRAVLHTSSIELSFDFRRSRWAEVCTSPSMRSTSFNPAVSLNFPKSIFACVGLLFSLPVLIPSGVWCAHIFSLVACSLWMTGTDGHQTQKRKRCMSGEVRKDEWQRQSSLNGRKEWYCGFCFETNVGDKSQVWKMQN